MLADFIGCWIVEITCKHFFADIAPKPLVTRGRERRERRRAQEEQLKVEHATRAETEAGEKKTR